MYEGENRTIQIKNTFAYTDKNVNYRIINVPNLDDEYECLYITSKIIDVIKFVWPFGKICLFISSLTQHPKYIIYGSQIDEL